MAITLMRLEKKIIELNNNVYDTYKEIDKDVDTIKSDCESIDNNICVLNSIINIIHNYVKGADTTINATLQLIKNINECSANNHNEVKDKLYSNYAHISDVCIQLDKLSAQINKRNTKLITAKNSSRPHKVAKPVAHPKNND